MFDIGEFCVAGVSWANRDNCQSSSGDTNVGYEPTSYAECGAPSGFRTPDPLIKSQLLYQLS